MSACHVDMCASAQSVWDLVLTNSMSIDLVVTSSASSHSRISYVSSASGSSKGVVMSNPMMACPLCRYKIHNGLRIFGDNEYEAKMSCNMDCRFNSKGLYFLRMNLWSTSTTFSQGWSKSHQRCILTLLCFGKTFRSTRESPGTISVNEVEVLLSESQKKNFQNINSTIISNTWLSCLHQIHGPLIALWALLAFVITVTWEIDQQ